MTTNALTINDAPYAEWREQLAPWLRALRKADISAELPPLPTVSDIEELWIHVKTPEGDANTREEWTPFIEALEMMELLARVEPCAAWHLLLELTGQQHIVTQYKTLLFESSGVLPKFVVQVKEDVLLQKSTFPGLAGGEEHIYFDGPVSRHEGEAESAVACETAMYSFRLSLGSSSSWIARQQPREPSRRS